MKLFSKRESDQDIVKMLQTATQGCRAGIFVFAAEKASQFTGPTRHLMHAGCNRRQRLSGVSQNKQSLPLTLVKRDGTRRLWTLTRKLLDVLDSPRHHQINGEAVLPHGAIAELTSFNAADTLDGSVVLLDTPALFIPVDFLQCLFQVIDFNRGHQHPLHGLFWRGRIDLGDIDRPNPERPEYGFALGRTQLHLSKANLKPCIAGRSPLAFGNAQQTLSRNRLAFHVLPQTHMGVLDTSIALGSNQKLGIEGIFLRQQKKLVDIGFAITHTDHGGGAAELALQPRRALKALKPFVALFLFDGPLVAFRA